MNEWDVTTRDGFFTCYRSTVRELCAYAGLLAGPDRATAEQIVRRGCTPSWPRGLSVATRRPPVSVCCVARCVTNG
jgi:hypothetical protein